MSTLGSVVGFGVVFLLIAVITSAIGGAALVVAARWLAARGPAAERTAALVVAVAPPIAAGLVVLALVWHSAVAIDHCTAHDHHAHLCVEHGGAWLARPWAVALAGAAMVVAVGRALVLGAAVVGARARLRTLARFARDVDGIQVVDSPRRFCFVAGVRRPTIYASTGAWHALTAAERAAMLAHERAHIDGRDGLWRGVIAAATLVAAPLMPGLVVGRWADATERLRDREAALATDPIEVAQALIAMCRDGEVAVPGLGYRPTAATVAARVTAVLAIPVDAPPASGRIAVVAAALGATTAGLLAAFVAPIHHALETLLG